MSDYKSNPSPYLRQSVANTPYRVLEWTTFLDTLGAVAGDTVLDVACGDGRLSRILAHAGAKKVLGVDRSPEMISRATAQNREGADEAFPSIISYACVDATDESFTLDEPADVVTAMYLFHYAPNVGALNAMCRFLGRNLQPGGRFVTYTINPSYDATDAPADMEQQIGFAYRIVDPPQYAVVIGELDVPIYQWSTADHEEGLKAAGFEKIAWHPLTLPPGHDDVARKLGWYLKNPSCIVLSATKQAGA